MAKGDDVARGTAQSNQINQNALMGRGGLEQQARTPPFVPQQPNQGMFGGMLESLMPYLQSLGLGQSNTPAANAARGAGKIPSAIQRLRGNNAGSSMGGNPPPNPFEQGRGRAMGAVNAAANRFNAPPAGGQGGGGNQFMPQMPQIGGGGGSIFGGGGNMQLPNQGNNPYLQNPNFLQSLMGGGGGPMRQMY